MASVVALGAGPLGCGRLGYDELPPAAAGVGDGGVDAQPVASCSYRATFTAPRLLDDLSSTDDESSLRVGGGVGYFARATAAAGARIYVAAKEGDGFEGPVLLAGPVNEDVAEGPAISADGSVLAFATTRGGNGYDLWASMRSGTSFPTPSPVAQLMTDLVEVSPYLLASGQALYFSRVVPNSGVALLRAARDGIGAPVSVSTIPVVGNPVVSEDELELLYSVNGDIYQSTRSSRDDAFTTGALVAALSGGADDAPSWLSPDGCTLYLQSRRAGGRGGLDLWMSTRR